MKMGIGEKIGFGIMIFSIIMMFVTFGISLAKGQTFSIYPYVSYLGVLVGYIIALVSLS